MSLGKSRRAGQIGGSRGGGSAGGYERLDPDFEGVRLRHLHAEYLSLDAAWRKQYLGSLSARDKFELLAYLKVHPGSCIRP